MKNKSLISGFVTPVEIKILFQILKKVMQYTFDSVSIAPYILDVCNDLSFNYILSKGIINQFLKFTLLSLISKNYFLFLGLKVGIECFLGRGLRPVITDINRAAKKQSIVNKSTSF